MADEGPRCLDYRLALPPVRAATPEENRQTQDILGRENRFSCASPATHAGILQAQYQHLAEENQRLTVEVQQLQSLLKAAQQEIAALKLGHRYVDNRPRDSKSED